MSPPLFRLWLFGEVRADFDGKPVRVAARPLCAVLLAMLAVRPGARVARKALANELWPDESDPGRAGGNLRRHLSTLLAAMPPLPRGENWIEAEGTTLAWSLERNFWCDAVAFEKALTDPDAEPEALRIKGDFMAGYASDWVVASRESFRARAVERLLGMCVERQDDDRIEEALACAEAALQIDPLCETGVQLAIELHGERGDAMSAGQVFAVFAERVRRELDASPAAETIAAIERVRVAAGTRRERLPQALTTFVGRTAAMESVEAALARSRCVTIVGPGGVGKTRLSLETGRHVAQRYLDGSYFVDLSTLPSDGSPSDVLFRSLELPSELARSGPEGVKRFLRNRRALLIFDNCEHVRAQVAELAHELLGAAPRITILATSRVALGIEGETIYRLEPLSQAESRALFAERTRSAGGAAGWNRQDAGRIDRLCAMLDRVPLAIELAAGLTRSMALADIERHLPDRFAMLRSDDPSRPERHRTLEATIAWSYELLEAAERRLFERLAVFPASFGFDAALEVCDAAPATFLALVDKSIVQRDESDAGRYRLLFSLSEFARPRFERSEDAELVRDRHARRYAELLLFAETPGYFRGEARWIADVESDLDNVRAALRRLLAPGADAALGIRAALAVERFFVFRGFFAEGIAWLELALERAAPGSRAHGLLRYNIGRFIARQGDHRAALAWLDEALTLARAAPEDLESAGIVGDIAAINLAIGEQDTAHELFAEGLALADRTGNFSTRASILANLGVLAGTEGDHARSAEYFTEAAHLFKRKGDRRFLARMLCNLATNEFFAGRYEAAVELLNEALAIVRDIGAVVLIIDFLCALGEALCAGGRHAEAAESFGEALGLARPLGLPYALGHALLGFAGLAAARGDTRLAARLCGAGAPYLAHDMTSHIERSFYQLVKAAVLAELGEAEFERLRHLGELLESDEAIELATRPAEHSLAT